MSVGYRKYLLVCLFSLWAQQLFGQENTNIFKGDNFSLHVNGEVYTYHLLKKEQTTIIAVDGIELRVDNMVITARKAAWYPNTQDIYIEGDIQIKGENFIFRAQQMTYNLKDRKGIIQKPEATLNAPEQIKRTDDSNLVELDRGKFLFVTSERIEMVKETFYFTQLKITTNGYAKPFYHIKATDAKYENGASFQSWNNVLKIGKIPLFYFPYLAKDLKNNWPWFHLSIDQSSRYGMNATLKTKTSFDGQTVLVAAKPMELRGILGSVEYTKKNETADIFLSAEGLHEKWRGNSKVKLSNYDEGFHNKDDNSIITSEDRYRLHGIYKQKMMWNFSFEGELDKIDSTNRFIWKSNDEYRINQSALNSPFANGQGDLKKGSYRRDYYRSDFFEDKSPESIGQLKWNKGPYAARLLYKFDANDFSYGEERNNNQELEIKPGAIFDINSLELIEGSLPLYLDGYFRLESLTKEFTRSDNSTFEASSERLALRTTIATRYAIAQMFNVEIYGGFDETGYSDVDVSPKISQGRGLLEDDTLNLDFDLDTHTNNNINRFTGIYGSSINFEAKKYYSIDSNLFNFQGMVHRIVPRIDFIGSSKPNKDPSELPQFDTIDALQKDDYLLLSLKNFFDIKDSKGWHNFIKLDAWAKYNLDREQEQAWEHITTEFQFQPTKKIVLRSNFRFRPGEGLVRSISTLTFKWNDFSEITVAERWETDFPWQTDVNIKFKAGERYSVEAGCTYLNKKPPVGNQDRDQFTEYYFAIQRKYHELLISLEYRRDRLFDEQSVGLSFRFF
jgi:hypothetical protein